MGQTISQLKNPKGGVDVNKSSEKLLNELSKQLESLGEQKKEGATVFSAPLKWESGLEATDFPATIFDVTSNNVTSREKSSSGKPFLSMNQSMIEVSTFEYIGHLLNVAGEKRLAEIQRALKGNADPLGNIFGEYGLSAHGDMTKIHDKLVAQENADPNKKEQIEGFQRLLFVLNNIDAKLMKQSIEELSKDVKISMSTVTSEVELLRSFCGPLEDTCAIYLDWESSYVSSNGVRSPPWRQLQGDLALIKTKTHEGVEFIILANTAGFWKVKNPEGGKITYERVGDVFPSIVALMRGASDRFNLNIDHQEFVAKVLPKAKLPKADDPAGEGDRDADSESEHVTSSPSKPEGAPLKSALKTDPMKTAAKHKKKDDSATKRLQPSQKWATLGLEGLNATKPAPPKNRSATKHGSAKSVRSHDSASRTLHTSTHEDPLAVYHKAVPYTDDSDSQEQEDELEERRLKTADLPPEYWSIQKLIKYLSGGNQTATIISLCSLRDFDLTSEACQYAIRDVGGLDLLVNLLETEDTKCKIGALKILKDVSLNKLVKKSLADTDAIHPIVNQLDSTDSDELLCVAALTLANCADYGKNRFLTRKHGGITKLVALLSRPSAPDGSNELARCAALGLWSCSKSRQNKKAIIKAGALPLLANLVKSSNIPLLIPVVGVLEECSAITEYRNMIIQAGIVPFLVRHIEKDDVQLKTHCSIAIFHCGEDPVAKNIVRENNGPKLLVDLLQQGAHQSLIWGASGAIWKCAQNNKDIAEILTLMKGVEALSVLLTNQPEHVLINVVGGLSELVQSEKGRKALKSSGGMDPLINLLTGTNQELLVHVTRTVGLCARDPDCMGIIDKMDGVRLLWSLLKSPNPLVQANAAWAISPCIENTKDAGELVRSFVGGLELVIGLLRSEELDVVASVCCLLANIAKDQENLAVITDHGVVPMLSGLVHTDNDLLREHLADAIAECCNWGTNRAAFGEHRAVAPLVGYLKSSSPLVHQATGKALFELSKYPPNCITMHEQGVVKLLLVLVGSENERLQENAASCIGNIRRLALANEKARAS